MAIPAQDYDSDSSESEGSASNLPRKTSYSQLLATYLQMGFLSCFGVGPERRPRVAAVSPSTSLANAALRRQMSRPQEVPQDEFEATKDEPYAQIVESYGPENSVPASFRTSFLGANFDNEFSLTNGNKWTVWQKPGVLSEEAIAHFQGQPGAGQLESPQEGLVSSTSFSEETPGLSPHSDELSPHEHGDGPSDGFALPQGHRWEGWGGDPGRDRESIMLDKGEPGLLSKRVSSQGVEEGREPDAEGPSDPRSSVDSSCKLDSQSNEVDTSDGAALLSKLGAPHTIPLTPEIEEELRRSESFHDPAILTREFSIASTSSNTPELEAAGLHSSSDLLRSNSTPSTRTQMGNALGAELPWQDLFKSPGHQASKSTGLLKSQSASKYHGSLGRPEMPRRTQSLKSGDSMKSVKETHQIEEGEDTEGHKTVNQYIKLRRLGTGSYGKVVLHKDSISGKLYAMKILHRSRLMHVRISGEETAWTDVLREIAIMKQLDHPNLVSLEEVIDDPDNDKIYMVLAYEEQGPVFEGTGPEGGIGEERARACTRDVLAGLQYLHFHNIVHGDIKPDNLMMSADGRIKIGDFGVSHIFENDNDQLRRSPGTPAFTAPECCLGAPYHGKPADVWALGCTLYVFVTGRYPFMTDSRALGALYQVVLHQEVVIPNNLSPDLQDLLRRLLEKDPEKRITVEEAALHPWLTTGLGPLLQVELRAIDVDAAHISAALTQLDSASKARLARLFARHAAALRRRKAASGREVLNQDIGSLLRSPSIRSTDAYDSDFSANSSRPGSPRREAGQTSSPLRTGSSNFGAVVGC